VAGQAEAQMRRFDRRFQQALAFGPQILGELDDQDGVFRRQADDGDETHLEVDVIRHIAERDCRYGANNAECEASAKPRV